MIGDSASLTSDPGLEHRGDRARTTTVNSNDESGLTVAVHQPHYLPWLGLIDKIDRSDRYIVLDTVQFERRGWQNRNYIAGAGKPLLLTVPVEQTSRDELIMDKTIDNTQKWKRKHYKALVEHCYRKTPYLSEYLDEITHLYESEWESLVELSIATTRLLLRAFGITTPMVRASELGDFPGHKDELLAQICAKAGASTLLSGNGAKNYLEPKTLHRYGVDIEWQNFQHPVYTQHSRGSTDFVPRMAAIDLLVNAGPDSLRVLRQARSQH